MKISSRITEMPLSAHRKLVWIAEQKRKEGKTVYNFSLGQPGLPPDVTAIKGLCQRLNDQPFESSRYVDTRGLLELRQAISWDVKHYGALDVPPDQIIVTDGAVEGLVLSLTVLTEPGDRIAVFDPCYSVYWDLMRLHGLRAVPIQQRIGDSFQPDPEEIKTVLASKVAAVLLCSPDNPTGRIISEEAAKTIVDEVAEKGITLLYDEAYKHILYEGRHVWIQRLEGTDGRLISLNSFSKDLAIPGFRLGYAYGPEEVIEQIAKVKAFTSICSPTVSQCLALEYLTKNLKQRYLSQALPVYQGRRDAIFKAFTSLLPRAWVMKPEAGLYLFPDLSRYLDDMGVSDVNFSLRLAEEADVMVIPGSAFGPRGANHVRLSFVGEPEEKLEAGVQRMADFILKGGSS